MRSTLTIAPALALVLSAGSFSLSQAQNLPQAQKIAVIDMQSALIGTKDGAKAAAELKAKFAPKEQEFQKRQSDLQAKQDQYRKTENTISDEQKAALTLDIQTLTRNLQRDMQDAQQDAQQEEQLVLGGLSQKMQQVINKYAADKQLTAIFDVAGQPNNLIFASTTIDITRDIIALYDQAAAVTPAAKPPAAAAPKPAPAPAAATPKPATPATSAPPK